MIWPVMNEALPEAANRMASAISSGRPARFNGMPVGIAGEAIEHRGLDWTGRDRVDANAEHGAFKRSGFGQAFDGVLAGGVQRRIRCATTAHGRGYIDNAAKTLRLHYTQ